MGASTSIPPYIGRERTLYIPSTNRHSCSPIVVAVPKSIDLRATATNQKATRRHTKWSDMGGLGGKGERKPPPLRISVTF